MLNKVRVTYSQQRGILRDVSSFIRTFTVGFGFSPNLLTFFHQEKALAGCFTFSGKNTAGRELHPALKII
jgi:hypothetical protein